ncbi:PLCG1 [Mytilus coruscus]|uniref:PLCG1 n=1 Tax=Mytilus coruscus TaxID=42192 RepID=A0A6J8BMM0_MYTCO|nr:PLCG1 [Mytilus coruscus]
MACTRGEEEHYTIPDEKYYDALKKKLLPALKEFVDRILKALSEGMVLHKIKDGGILYPRKFILDTQNMKLRYTGSEKKFRKKKTSWDLSNIREVREGEKDYAKRLEPFDRGRCIAVIFGANHHVLHLLTESKPERDMWLKGLRFAQNMEQYMDQKEQTDKYPFINTYTLHSLVV